MYYFEPVTGFMLIDSLLSDQSGAFTSALSHLVLPSLVLATLEDVDLRIAQARKRDRPFRYYRNGA